MIWALTELALTVQNDGDNDSHGNKIKSWDIVKKSFFKYLLSVVYFIFVCNVESTVSTVCARRFHSVCKRTSHWKCNHGPWNCTVFYLINTWSTASIFAKRRSVRLMQAYGTVVVSATTWRKASWNCIEDFTVVSNVNTTGRTILYLLYSQINKWTCCKNFWKYCRLWRHHNFDKCLRLTRWLKILYHGNVLSGPFFNERLQSWCDLWKY